MKNFIHIFASLYVFLLFFLDTFFLFAGEELKIPKRIVSLSPPATEQIFLLGASDRIAGCTSYCLRPVEAKKKDKVDSSLNIRGNFKITTLE